MGQWLGKEARKPQSPSLRDIRDVSPSQRVWGRALVTDRRGQGLRWSCG